MGKSVYMGACTHVGRPSQQPSGCPHTTGEVGQQNNPGGQGEEVKAMRASTQNPQG